MVQKWKYLYRCLKATHYIELVNTMNGEYLQQEAEETFNEKAGISALTIDNSENVSIITANFLLDIESSTISSLIVSIAPSADTLRNTIPTTPHTVDRRVAEAFSPGCQSMTNFKG